MNTVMTFDFHVHSMLSKSIPFSLDDLYRMINQARKRQLSGFALTEHIHAPSYWETYRSLLQVFPYKNGVFNVAADFHILNGAEINIADGGHLIVIGDMEAIHALDKKFDLNAGYQPTLDEVLAYAPDSVILHGAHPFRPYGGIIKASTRLLRRLSALELNGKDFHMEGMVRQAVSDLRMPLVGGSDAHFWLQVGISCTSMPRDAVSISTLRSLINSGLTRTELHPNSAGISAYCSYYKYMLKRVMLGTKYVKKRLSPTASIRREGVQLAFA